jgi:hypothetical protein
LEILTSPEAGYFAMHQCGGGPDESVIRANRDGLRLYAIELLKASLGKEHCIGESEVPWLFDDSSVWIMNVELVEGNQEEILKISDNQKHGDPDFVDRALLTGCASIGVLLLAIFIIGLKTVIQLFF